MLKKEFYQTVLEHIYEGVYFVDRERKITFWNKGAERITGYLAEEVIGTYCHDNLLKHINECGDELCKDNCPLAATICDGMMREAEVYLHHKQGYRVPVSIHSIAIEEDGCIVGAVETFRDNSYQHRLYEGMQKLKKDAITDPLTELYNRRYLYSFLQTKENEYQEFAIPFGVVFLDVDNFRDFNNNYGHDIGDKVLKMVAQTMLNSVLNTDVVARWGGDEFTIVMPGISKDNLANMANKIKRMVEHSGIDYQGNNLSVTVSLGASYFTEQDTIETLMKRADDHLHESKLNGRNQVTTDR